MKRFLPFIFALVLSSLPLAAQEDVSPLIFDSYVCDFGEVEESGGTLFHTFHFINGASSKFRILRVSASCSCVSVSYPQSVLEGGETGEISVAFNPARTFGDVERDVDIFLTEGMPGVSLVLKAHVIPSEYDIEDIYSVSLPDGVRMTSLTQRFGYLAAGRMAERRIDVINSSESPVTLEAGPESEAYLTVACPERLGPGEAGSLILRYTLPDDVTSLGMHEDRVSLLVNGRPCNRQVETSCIGIRDLAGAKGPAPSLQVEPSGPVMKKALLGKGYSGSITVRNGGRGDLVILKADLPAGAVCDLPDGTVVSPGASRKVKVESPSASFRFGLVTNDPSRPYKEMRTSTK